MLEGIIGGFVWAAANYLYIDMRRKGRRGFARIALFWMGVPWTWLWLFVIPEGTDPELPPPEDDAEGLLEEIRRKRALMGEVGDHDTDEEGPTPSGGRTFPA